MPFRGVDYYATDDLLSPDERLVRDSVRRFVDRMAFVLRERPDRAADSSDASN